MKKALLLSALPGMASAKIATAIFAGGCFWCLQADFDKLKGQGVIDTASGYDGGTTNNPTYKLVSSGTTNYAEAVKVTYDTDKISYSTLLDHFWKNIDPTVKDAQFCDKGRSYRSAIFYLNDQQKTQAEQSLKTIKQSFPVVYTEITPSTHFYPAEDYHQDFHKKNPVKYLFYRWNCGRDQRLKQLWKPKHQ